MIYRVASSMFVVRLWDGIEIGHVNIRGHAFALSAFAIVVIVEVVNLFMRLLLRLALVFWLLRLLGLLGLLRRWHLRHRRPLLRLSRRCISCSSSGGWSRRRVCW
jgi:hypothetical protein